MRCIFLKLRYMYGPGSYIQYRFRVNMLWSCITRAINELMHYTCTAVCIQNFIIFSTTISIFYNILFFFHRNPFFGFYRDIWHRTFWPLRRESLDPCNYRGSCETTVADCCYNPASALQRGQATRDTQNERTPGHHICRKGGICDSCRMKWMNCHVNPPKLKKNEICRKGIYNKQNFVRKLFINLNCSQLLKFHDPYSYR